MSPLDHTHEWHRADTPGADYQCTWCLETTNACTECDRPLDVATTVCTQCLDAARKIVRDIARWRDTIPFETGVILGLRAIRYDNARGHGDQLPFGLDQLVDDPEDIRIAAIRRPEDAIAILHGWAEAWAEKLDDNPATADLAYLEGHTLWAMQNQDASGWPDYHHEALQVRATVRRLLGINDEPELVPCVHCGGRIVRAWTPDGLDDAYRCTRCHMTWPNKARLDHTNAQVLHALPTTHPDALMPMDDIKRVYRHQIRANLLDLWVHRGHLQPAGTDLHGRPVYRLGDISDRLADSAS